MAKRKLGKKSRKEVMGKHKGYKYVFIPCTIVIVASLVYLIWYMNTQNSTYDNILYIRSFMTSSGTLNDFQNKIGMKDPETDIKWYKTDDEIRIEFGRIFLTWEPEDFYAEENLQLLSSIGITTEIQKGTDGVRTLHVFYHGEELERWVK